MYGPYVRYFSKLSPSVQPLLFCNDYSFHDQREWSRGRNIMSLCTCVCFAENVVPAIAVLPTMSPQDGNKTDV